MLRAIMECRGKFSHKVLRKAEFGRQHFDDLLNFRSIEKDKLTGKVNCIDFYEIRLSLILSAGPCPCPEFYEAQSRPSVKAHDQRQRHG